MNRRQTLCAALAILAVPAAGATAAPRAAFTTGAGAMAIVSVAVPDPCRTSGPPRATALATWLDGRHDHEILLFPGSGRERYESLVGPLAPGRHVIDLRPSTFWAAEGCLDGLRPEVTVVEAGSPRHLLLAHAPVLELRADTVGEQTDLPLYAYVEEFQVDLTRTIRYTVVFSHEDGGTPTRALLARWGRTTDIEEIYTLSLGGAESVREAFQGPDHEIRPFGGRRRGAAPVLLVSTLNNMVTDRGRGVAAVRLLPDPVDLARATRESTLDTRSWAYRVMARELEAEGRISADAPVDERWARVAPDPRDHAYLEARLTLDHALAAAWVRDSEGRRHWSHYGREVLAIDRSGWVRAAVAVGSDPAASLAEAGWACLQDPESKMPGSCVIEAERAFVFEDGWKPGRNLVASARLELRAGQEAGLALIPRRSP